MVKTQKNIRVHMEQWEQASVICEKMNTNLSAVINQLIAQIIIQKKIPFSLYLEKQDEELLFNEKVEETVTDILAQDNSRYISGISNNGTSDDEISSDRIDSVIEEQDNAYNDNDIMDWSELDLFGKKEG